MTAATASDDCRHAAASLGPEIQKALALADGYEVYGCAVSPTAYGVHDPAFAKTHS